MKFLKWFLGILVVLILIICVVTFGFFKSTLPEYDGEIAAPVLSDDVEIIRDSYGMAHIYASNDADLSFAFGYATAQDRLFQMDMARRAGGGRLSEVLGESLVPADKLFRTIRAETTLEEAFEAYDTEVQATIESFVAGVNFYIEHHEGPYPPEFLILGYEPDPFTPEDIMAIYFFLAWDQNYPIESELVHASVIEAVGEEMADELFVDFPPGCPTIIPKGALYFSSVTEDILDAMTVVRETAGITGLPASNNWAISPEKSETGTPIFANDPHVGVGAPSMFYEAHLVTPTMNVSGSVISGLPAIVAGANEHVAWGVTNVSADDADFYLERINPDDPNQYEYLGRWEDMVVKTETISVKDSEDVTFDIRMTRHGPIIDDMNKYDEPEGYSISLRWVAVDFPNSPQFFYYANRAEDIEDIEKAVGFYKCFGFNFVYADDQGNIGYWMGMGIPVRDGFTGGLPLPGWDGEHEWNGYLPTELQPHMKNPPSGWIATANNKTVGDEYPYYISANFATPDRYIRISEMMEEKEKLGVDDFKRMQSDTKVLLARDWVPLLLEALDGMELTETENRAVELLEEWDYTSPPDSAAAAVFHAFLNNLVENIFMERLGEDLYKAYVGNNKNIPFNSLRTMIDRGKSPWFDDPTTEEIEDMNAVFVKSFHEGVAYLEEELSPNPKDWKWGDLHTVTLYHSFGKKSALLGRFMNIGPFPIGGSIFTVAPTVYRVERSWEVTSSSGMRHIIDLSENGDSYRIIPGGVNGNFMSPHYDDQAKMWVDYEYRPFVLEREKVEEDAVHTLVLKSE
ncbi:MAG: penicillin acylase family protein [Deltaproteobacteria bacterium]|nr:penicillin acylase family protein [Candidatus Zymogenaceae bacterium]